MGEQKNVLITGGASGIGLALTKFFASQGANVAVLDVNPGGAAIVSSLSSEFMDARLVFKKCDVSDWDDQALVFDEVYKEFGRLDIVMANAGIPHEISLVAKEDVPSKPSMKSMDVNLSGIIFSTKLAIHYLQKNQPHLEGKFSHRGSIFCTASSAGIYPFPLAPLYGCAKHGVVGLARSLGYPLSQLGIQINALAPAVIETNMTSETSYDSQGEMVITPMATLIRAVQDLVSKPSTTGQIAVIHGDKVTFAPHASWVDDDVKKIFEIFKNSISK